MNKIIQLTDNEAKELKDLIGSYDKTLAEIDDLEKVKKHLLALEKLDFRDNLDLEMLPESICKLEQVKQLDLTHCQNLTTLPKNIGNLKELQELYLYKCKNLKTLPDSICKLKNLKILSLSYCIHLTTLPSNLKELSNLEKLYLYGCKNIINLPESISELKELRILVLSYCHKIKTLPDTIGQLEKLEELYLYECKNISSLPDSICKLENLKVLSLSRCYKLQDLPNIWLCNNLTELYLNYCIKLKKISEEILNLNKLIALGLCDSDNIEDILNNIHKLENLTHLYLLNCGKITQLPESIFNLKKLIKLDLTRCNNLTKISEKIDNLKQLQELRLFGCKNIQILSESINNLEKLDNQSLFFLAFFYYNQDKIEAAEKFLLKIKYDKQKDRENKNNKCYLYEQIFLASISNQSNKIEQFINRIEDIVSDNEEHIKNSIKKIKRFSDNYKKYLLKILLQYLIIRELLVINMSGSILNTAEETSEDAIAHYTTPYVAMKLLKQEKNKNESEKNKTNKIRLSIVSQFNDPNEGQTIFNYFNNLNILKNNNIILKPISQLATFVSCFTFNHDKLNHFRLYGKEQGKEASGISIVLDYQFFNTERTTDGYSKNMTKKEQKNLQDDEDKKLTLYRCIYLHPTGELDNKPYIRIACRDKLTFYREKGGTEEDLKKYIAFIKYIQDNVNKQLNNIQESIKSLFLLKVNKKDNKKLKEKLIKTISFILMPLSYMVKHSAYEEEQECRIFKFLPSSNINNENIDIDNGRMYAEYLSINGYVEKIYLAPHSGKYADIFRVLTNGKVEVRLSDNPFR